MKKPRLVVSAVGLVEGGTLSILLDLAEHLSDVFGRDEVLYLINGRVANHFAGKQVEVYSWPKRSWAARVWFEKVFVRELERRLQPKAWLSLHDITAGLRRTRQFLYCHNPSPFFDRSIPLPVLDIKFELFSRFYDHLYRWGIHKNERIVVQQDWMRQEFLRRYPLRSEQVLVARPIRSCDREIRNTGSSADVRTPSPAAPLLCIYPTLPRVFKNVEFIGELARSLAADPIKFLVTISGTENRYARFIERNYGHLPTLDLIGRQPRAAMARLYEQADALVFPSRLETWGLPLSEFMATGKPIFAADLPYAREVLAGYSMADLLPLDDVGAAVQKIRGLANAQFRPKRLTLEVQEPFCPDWRTFAAWLARSISEES